MSCRDTWWQSLLLLRLRFPDPGPIHLVLDQAAVVSPGCPLGFPCIHGGFSSFDQSKATEDPAMPLIRIISPKYGSFS